MTNIIYFNSAVGLMDCWCSCLCNYDKTYYGRLAVDYCGLLGFEEDQNVHLHYWVSIV